MKVEQEKKEVVLKVEEGENYLEQGDVEQA